MFVITSCGNPCRFCRYWPPLWDIRACFGGATDVPDTAWLRAELRAGRIKGFGEMSPQYLGMSPADERLDPYWELAEEFDVPVGIHMGPGPPGVAAHASESIRSSHRRSGYSSEGPLILEDGASAPPAQTIFVMHAGWPSRIDGRPALRTSERVTSMWQRFNRRRSSRAARTTIISAVSWRLGFPNASCSGQTFPINSARESTPFSRQTS